jgi:hypothetical protein
MTVAIIGAGMAGLACARALADRGTRVQMFEKSRGLGGRCATRHDALHDLRFDHGAQFVRSKGGRFGNYLHDLGEKGIVVPWPAANRDGEQAYVAIPGMNALVKPLGANLEIVTSSRIITLSRTRIGWTLICENGTSHADFEAVILAIPAPQAAELLGPHRFAARLRADVTTAPCFATMLHVAGDIALPDVFVPPASRDGIPPTLAWIARDSARPGRDKTKVTFVLHASTPFSQSELEHDPPEVAVVLEQAFRALARRETGSEPGETLYRSGHRWRFATTTKALREPCLWDPDWQIGVCGDFCLGARIRHAYQSGISMAHHLMV